MVKVAFLILAHCDPVHLERLVKAISHESSIFIHLDKKTHIDEYVHIADIASVNFIPERVKVYWGGVSMVKAILNLIKTALASEESFSHIVLLSGADYPIKHVSKFYDFLGNNPGTELMKLVSLSKSPEPREKRLYNYWFLEPFQTFFDDSLFRRALQKFFHLMIPRNLPDRMSGQSLAWGSGNWAITSECASFI
ncbi:MAG: beta-1,6-N-acetylglucosaminyltransferase, partial [Cyanobacteria bacterium J06641_5]